MRLRHSPLSALLALGAVLVSGCGEDAPPPRQQRRPNILLLSIDTLRADHLSCYGYSPAAYREAVSPAIDGLAEQGTRFTRAFAPRGQTAPSLCSMMTGKYPSSHGVQENAQPFQGTHPTLAEVLRQVGYRTAAFVSFAPAVAAGAPTLGADHIAVGMAPGLEQWEWDVRAAGSFVEWLKQLPEGSSRPFYAWVHLYDVHRPYAPRAPYHEMFRAGYEGKLRVPEQPAPLDFRRIDDYISRMTVAGEALSPEDHAYVLGLYDGGVRCSDDLVGGMLEALRAQDLEDDTLVILTADHGEELADRNLYYFHGNSVYDGTLKIPLVIRWPGEVEAGAVHEELVQNLDLVPTVLDWLGVDPPPDLDGISFAARVGPGGSEAAAREYAFIEWQDLIWSVRTRDHKYIHNPLGVHPKKPPFFKDCDHGFAIRCRELYDLRSDPRERHNRLDFEPELAGRLQAEVEGHMGRPARVAAWTTTSDPETLRQLQEIGYVGPLEGRPDVLFGAEDCKERR